MRYWLMKSEPSEVSIDDLINAPESTLPWTGVRNYQARNFMRDAMQVGDAILFYHSSCARPGVVGLAVVASTPYPDPTQFDPHSPYFDAKATQQQPRWVSIDVRAVEKTPLLALAQLRTMSALEDMLLLKKGSRLSITPVAGSEWSVIVGELLSELQRAQQGER